VFAESRVLFCLFSGKCTNYTSFRSWVKHSSARTHTNYTSFRSWVKHSSARTHTNYTSFRSWVEHSSARTHTGRGANNHSPTRPVRVEFKIGESKIQTHSQAWRWFFYPLTDNFYILGQLFSDLASDNFQLHASLASVLKNLSTPLHTQTHAHTQTRTRARMHTQRHTNTHTIFHRRHTAMSRSID
jgi:hypothetical protein